MKPPATGAPKRCERLNGGRIEFGQHPFRVRVPLACVDKVTSLVGVWEDYSTGHVFAIRVRKPILIAVTERPKQSFGNGVSETGRWKRHISFLLADWHFAIEGIMSEKPSTTLPGTVEKIIKSPIPDEPEKAQIAVEGADHLYREIRIENTLTNEEGEEVSLKPGAQVEVTVVAEAEATTPKN